MRENDIVKGPTISNIGTIKTIHSVNISKRLSAQNFEHRLKNKKKHSSLKTNAFFPSHRTRNIKGPFRE